MASSTVAVTKSENEDEKNVSFEEVVCEENGLSTQDEEKPEDSQESKPDAVPEKRSTRDQKKKIIVKITPSAAKKPKKVAKRELATPKKIKVKADVLTEESNNEDNPKPEDEKKESEDEMKTPKRGRKRKVEEKENVIDQTIAEEVQNINESAVADAKEPDESSPKKVLPKATKPKKEKPGPTTAVKDGNNQNLPSGWMKKVVVRKSGKTAGKADIYYYSPDGIKCRSKPDIAAYIKKNKLNLKLEVFDFSSKNVSDDTVVAASPKKGKSTPAKPKNSPEKKKTAARQKRSK